MMLFKRSKANGNGNGHHAAAPSVISQDVVIDGSVVTAGELHIDGTVNGSVRAQACVVDINGVVEGEISANEVFVRGRVIGPIKGNHVHLYAGSHVEGDVINETISIENGAYIYGSMRRADDPMAQPDPSRYGRESLFASPRLDFGQDNAFGDADALRPIKVLRPRS
jgi:cytoskeletal protein CcmA (bactofilin family)